MMKSIELIWQQIKEYFEPDPPGWDEFVKRTIELNSQMEAIRKKNGISDEQWQKMLEPMFRDFLEGSKKDQGQDQT